MNFQTLTLGVTDQVATVTLNRPEKLNTWTPVMGAELTAAFRAIDADRDVRVAVLTGAGDKAFCAGADMDFFAGQIAAKEGGGSRMAGVEEFPRLMRDLSKPTIAAINGYALGVGATIPLLCDMRVAAAEAKIGFLFSRMGVMAELGSYLPRAAHRGRGTCLRADAHREDVHRRGVRAHGCRESRGAPRRAPRPHRRALRGDQEMRSAVDPLDAASHLPGTRGQLRRTDPV
jgi:enoyl-CoA hydratase/carnithine racemase